MKQIKLDSYKYFAFAWLFPGLGHFLLGYKKKAVVFATIVVFMIGYGIFLNGQIYSFQENKAFDLFWWGALIELGMGPIYFIISHLPIHTGIVKSFTFEYGTSFIFAGAILNYFTIIDIVDILLGRHEIDNSVQDSANS